MRVKKAFVIIKPMANPPSIRSHYPLRHAEKTSSTCCGCCCCCCRGVCFPGSRRSIAPFSTLLPGQLSVSFSVPGSSGGIQPGGHLNGLHSSVTFPFDYRKVSLYSSLGSPADRVTRPPGLQMRAHRQACLLTYPEPTFGLETEALPGLFT